MMERSRSNLAGKVNALAGSDRATVTELRDRLILDQLDGRAAREVIDLLEPAGFALASLADEGGVFKFAELSDDAEGVQLKAWKPAGVPENIFPVLTLVGFQALFHRIPDEAIIWVEGLTKPIDTLTTSYRPWGDDAPFIPEDEPADPARVVRALGDANSPERIGRWLLRDAEAVVAGVAADSWRTHSTRVLSKALAQEIEQDGQILFRGPPATRFHDDDKCIEAPLFSALQKSVYWVYENPRELESRHGLMAAEIARTSSRYGNLADLGALMRVALEGAVIAYGFGLSQQSRDTLKSLSDLRKAVIDETSKIAEITRGLASAVMASAAGNFTLVIARLTINRNIHSLTFAGIFFSIALAIYVIVVIWSGHNFLRIQKNLRGEWREKIYPFLNGEDYNRMVSSPVEKAEIGFRIVAISGAVITAFTILSLIIVFFLSD